MQVAVRLLLDRIDDCRMTVAGVLAADPAGEVDVGAAVDVGDPRALGLCDDEPGRRDPGATYRARAAAILSACVPSVTDIARLCTYLSGNSACACHLPSAPSERCLRS